IDVAQPLFDQEARQRVLEERGRDRQTKQLDPERDRRRLRRVAAGIDQNELVDATGLGEGRSPGERAAERGATPNAMGEAELVRHPDHEIDVAVYRIEPVRRRTRESKPDNVEADDRRSPFSASAQPSQACSDDPEPCSRTIGLLSLRGPSSRTCT